MIMIGVVWCGGLSLGGLYRSLVRGLKPDNGDYKTIEQLTHGILRGQDTRYCIDCCEDPKTRPIRWHDEATAVQTGRQKTV